MADNLVFEGLSVAPNVIDTIVRIATEKVDGVTSVGGGVPSGAAALIKTKTPGIEIAIDSDQNLVIAVHIAAIYGVKLHELGAAIQEAISDALEIQLGVKVVHVDVYIDSLNFSAE
jgi:uncharacterized alkaline shock family protein YloU